MIERKNEIGIVTGGMAYFLAVLIPNLIGSLILFAIADYYATVNGISQEVALGSDFVLFASLVVIQLLIVGVTILAHKGTRNFMKNVTLSFKNIKAKHVMYTVFMSIGAIFCLSYINVFFMEFLSLFGYAQTPSPFPAIDTLGKYLIALVTIGVLPAVAEELLFRGLILRSLQKFSTKIAVIGSSLLFMLLHASPLQTPYQFLLGVILAVITIKTGNILYSMLLHFLNNGIAVSMEYFGFGAGEITTFMAMLSLLLVVAGVVCLILALKYFAKLPNIEKQRKIIADNSADGISYEQNERTPFMEDNFDRSFQGNDNEPSPFYGGKMPEIAPKIMPQLEGRVLISEDNYSDDSRLNSILKAQAKAQRRSEILLSSILYVIPCLILGAMWITLFIQGL